MSVTELLNWDLMNWMPQMKADLLLKCMLRGPAERSQPDTPSQGKSTPLMLYTGTKAYKVYNCLVGIINTMEISNVKITG